jgi:Mn-dependent DtxR family transcriptional regulator
MEHFISPEIEAELAAELHEPTKDPHGREIPKEPRTQEPRTH